jgi:hypothetical protein
MAATAHIVVDILISQEFYVSLDLYQDFNGRTILIERYFLFVFRWAGSVFRVRLGEVVAAVSICFPCCGLCVQQVFPSQSCMYNIKSEDIFISIHSFNPSHEQTTSYPYTFIQPQSWADDIICTYFLEMIWWESIWRKFVHILSTRFLQICSKIYHL